MHMPLFSAGSNHCVITSWTAGSEVRWDGGVSLSSPKLSSTWLLWMLLNWITWINFADAFPMCLYSINEHHLITACFQVWDNIRSISVFSEELLKHNLSPDRGDSKYKSKPWYAFIFLVIQVKIYLLVPSLISHANWARICSHLHKALIFIHPTYDNLHFKKHSCLKWACKINMASS